MEIPHINIAKLTDTASDRLVAEFRASYGETGFAYLSGHGIPPELVEAIFDASKCFHEQPLSLKQSIALDHNHRGYIAIDTSTDVNSKLTEVTHPNQSESFMMMREEPEDTARYLSGPNQWPDLHSFQETVEAYNEALTRLGQRLMRLALAACGTSMDAMTAFERPTTWLRLLHYPPLPPQSPGDLYGSAPHTDFGCLTILAQDTTGGLQVQTPSGCWIDVPPVKDTFVVNVGDMLRVMSNGQLLSTPHRVINRSGKERFSCVFFYDPDVAYDVAPLPGTGVPKFSSINFGDFLRSELAAAYDAHAITGDKNSSL